MINDCWLIVLGGAAVDADVAVDVAAVVAVDVDVAVAVNNAITSTAAF